MHGADPSAHGGLAESVALRAGHHNIAKMLFEKGMALRMAKVGQVVHAQGWRPGRQSWALF